MALSDELRRLADRAEEAERNARAAADKAKGELEADRERSREVATQQAEQLQAAAEAGRDKISSGWSEMQRNWNQHIAQIQRNVQAKKAEIDVDRAQRRAYDAEADANFAIDFAYSAIVEAEYAVIDADLAKKEAEELAATGASV
jgi:hypothetical protein